MLLLVIMVRCNLVLKRVLWSIFYFIKQYLLRNTLFNNDYLNRYSIASFTKGKINYLLYQVNYREQFTYMNTLNTGWFQWWRIFSAVTHTYVNLLLVSDVFCWGDV